MHNDNNLIGQHWDGKCPNQNCTHQEMYLNQAGQYECPSCKLQAQVSFEGVSILKETGTGKFQRDSGLRVSAKDRIHQYPSRQICEDQRQEKAA